MPYKDPERKRARQRERAKDPSVRARKLQYNKEYYQRKTKADIEFRRQLLSPFCCISCGESNPYAIDWHHVEEDSKEFHVRDVTRSHDSWWNEVLKCVPLCSNCHRKLHHDQLCLIPLKR